MKIQYVDGSLNASSMALLGEVEAVLDEYSRLRLTMTLRQLYYQLVSRDVIPNTVRDYKRLGTLVSKARKLGLISWYAIEDRARNIKSNTHWTSPQEIIRAAISSYKIDHWDVQYQPDFRVQVWIEKEALIGVIAPVCRRYDVPFLACKGFMSDSELWSVAQDMLRHYSDHYQQTVILHFGDHDPSGIDMTRDNEERAILYSHPLAVQVHRVALNYDQIEQYDPPPNPAKQTDTRYEGYARAFGDTSWELDALRPEVLAELVENNIRNYVDEAGWERSHKVEQEGIDWLKQTIGDKG